MFGKGLGLSPGPGPMGLRTTQKEGPESVLSGSPCKDTGLSFVELHHLAEWRAGSGTICRLTLSLGPAREWGRSPRSVSEGVNTLETLQ